LLTVSVEDSDPGSFTIGQRCINTGFTIQHNIHD